MFKMKKGFTLIELLLALALISFVIIMSTDSILLLFKSSKVTADQYDYQSAMRILTSEVSNTIRYSQAIFAVPQDYIQDKSKMDPEWEYIALTTDKKSVVNYRYNPDTDMHEEQVLVAPKDNLEFEIEFKKQSEIMQTYKGNTEILNDNILYFSVTAYKIETDSSGNTTRISQGTVFESELKSLNALQVVDKGTLLSPAIALAYKRDDNTYGEGRSHVVKIALILDRSGSMAWIPGTDRDPKSTETSRMTYLKKALIGDGLNGESGIIAKFATVPNIEVTIVPFSNSASYIINSSRNVPFFNAKLEKNTIVNQIKGITANGGTNTGDGIRLSFYNMKDFDTTGYHSHVEEHDFTIILVDGDSNMSSTIMKNGTNYYHRWDDKVYTTNSSWGFEYVTALGDTIRNEFDYKGEYYLIGYVTNPNSAGVNNIKNALNIPDNQVYMYNNSNFDLSAVFDNIATEIMAKTWLVTGPQIRK